MTALENVGVPSIFNPEDSLDRLLDLVKSRDSSQAPVQTDEGFLLIATNAIACWFAHNFNEHGGVLETTPTHAVLKFA